MTSEDCSLSSNGPAGAEPYFAEGAVLANRYEIRRSLGAGTLGNCYAAFDRNRAKEICVKVVWRSLLTDSQTRTAFLEQAKIACDLRHPKIVNVYDLHCDGDFHFLSMELLRGRTLRQEMNDRFKSGRQFSLAEVRQMLDALGEALQYAHESTVHGAIKPENIWLCDHGGVKLIDFGAAQCLPPRRLTMTSIAGATAYYLPPELAAEDHQLDRRGDQYSLAAVLYEVLTGERLVGVPMPAEDLRPDLPKAASHALARALSPDPNNRFDSIQGFCEAISTELKPGFVRRHRRALQTTVALAALAGIASIALLTDNSGSRWVRGKLASLRGPNWELQAEQARQQATASKLKLEGEWKTLLAETDQIQTSLDSGKQSVAANFLTNRFKGPLDIRSSTSDWRELRPRLLRMAYGLAPLTNVALPELGDETFDMKLAKQTTHLLNDQTRLLRLWRVLAYRVFSPGKMNQAMQSMELGDNLIARAKYRQAMLDFQKADGLFRSSLDLVQPVRNAVIAFDRAMSDRIEYLALATMNRLDDPKPLRRISERMTRAWIELTDGDLSTAQSELQLVHQEWTDLLQELLQSSQRQMIAAKQRWLALFERRSVPQLKHLGSPERLTEQAKQLIDARDWYAAHEKFYQAQHLYEQWALQVAELPAPPAGARANSLGMYFVPMSDKIWISIWETRVMDFDVFADTSGYDAGHRWRTLELEANFEQGPTHPVVWVTKETAAGFCQWLTHKEQSEGAITNAVYRLPTDLEWSHAIGLPQENGATPRERSGSFPGVFPWRSGKFPPPAIDDPPGNYGFFVESRYVNSDRHSFTSAVGEFAPQGPFSLYDLGGNVWEWCGNLYDPAEPVDGWTIRGASCFTESRERIESSFRGRCTEWSAEVGFRPVLEFR